MNGPRILVFDSGLGGLTVLSEVRATRPDAAIAYLADTAAFPYGALGEREVVDRVVAAVGREVERWRPDVVVIACNTASTLVLPYLRARFELPFVGTVPAIKPAAKATRTGMVSVLATPGTVKRDYTRALIDTYAYHLKVTLVGASGLAALAEADLRGAPVDDTEIFHQIVPAFVKDGDRRTDTVVLGCTHYPLLAGRLERLAPWPVTWIDPAPAIARRAASFLETRPVGATAGPGEALFTRADEDLDSLAPVLWRFGLDELRVAPLDLAAGTALAQP